MYVSLEVGIQKYVVNAQSMIVSLLEYVRVHGHVSVHEFVILRESGFGSIYQIGRSEDTRI